MFYKCVIINLCKIIFIFLTQKIMFTIITSYKNLFSSFLKNEVIDGGIITLQKTESLEGKGNFDWDTISDLKTLQNYIKNNEIDINEVKSITENLDKITWETKEALKDSLKDMIEKWSTINNEEDYNSFIKILKLLGNSSIANKMPSYSDMKSNVEKEEWAENWFSLVLEWEKVYIYWDLNPVLWSTDWVWVVDTNWYKVSDFFDENNRWEDNTWNNDEINFDILKKWLDNATMKILERIETSRINAEKKLVQSEKALAKSEKKLVEVKGELNKSEKKLDEVKDKLNKSEKELDEVKGELNKSEKALVEVKGELNEVKDKLNKNEKELDESENKIKELENQLAETEEALAESEETLTQTEEALAQSEAKNKRDIAKSTKKESNETKSEKEKITIKKVPIESETNYLSEKYEQVKSWVSEIFENGEKVNNFIWENGKEIEVIYDKENNVIWIDTSWLDSISDYNLSEIPKNIDSKEKAKKYVKSTIKELKKSYDEKVFKKEAEDLAEEYSSNVFWNIKVNGEKMDTRFIMEDWVKYAKIDTTWSDNISDYETNIEYKGQSLEEITKQLSDKYNKLLNKPKEEEKYSDDNDGYGYGDDGYGGDDEY